MADPSLTAERRPLGVRLAEGLRRRPWLQALMVFAASRLVTTVILLGFAAVQGPNPFSEPSPDYAGFAAIWDAVWYRWIAANGYPEELPRTADGHVGENAWAFLPLYPVLVRSLILLTGLPFEPLAVTVSVVFAAGAALLFHRLMTRVLPHGALYATALFCFAPTSAVLQVGYAESLQLFLLFLALLLLLERRYVLLIPVVALLAFTRPGALAFALALGLHAIHRFATRARDPFPLRQMAALAAAGLASAVLGFAWPAIAGLVTGEPDAYVQTELAWRAGYIGYQELVPFQPWILGAHFWLWFLGIPDPAAWVLGIAAVVALAGGFAVFLFTPAARRLGAELRIWLASYAVYLLAVFFPQSSTFRLLMPLAPALGALALPRSPVYRALMLAACVALQVVWVRFCWFVDGDGTDWSPP